MNGKILVVDDEPDLLDLLDYNLKADDYEVFTAKDGWEAVLQARTKLPDLVLLDVMLPGLDGFTVCEELRRHPETGKIPVIMLTAFRGEIARYHSIASGATDFVRKPFVLANLLRRIRAAMTMGA